jgi:hypothetical protein
MLKHDVQSRWCLWHAARFNQFPVLVKAKCISLEDHDRARIAPEMDDVPVPKPESPLILTWCGMPQTLWNWIGRYGHLRASSTIALT